MILFNFQRFLSRFLEIYGIYLPLLLSKEIIVSL